MRVTVTVPDWATHLVSDLGDMDRSPRRLEPGTGREVPLELADDVYFEYAFIDGEGRLRADPANPRRADNPWYPEVSALTGPEYRPDPLADPPEPARPGTVDRLRVESRTLHQHRRVIVVTPPGLEDVRLPLALVQDGVAFYRLARLADVLQALLAAGEARPARLAFVEPVERSREYAFHEGYLDFVDRELVPELRRRYPSTDELLAVGASLGGLFSANLALSRPGLVRTAVTFSGAFLGHPEAPDFYAGTRSFVAERLEGDGPPPGLRWYAECGTLEWLTDVNRRVEAALASHGTEHAHRERHAGHNWTNWRNGLASALRFALRP
ncbi:MAG TPA: alpha/beta hydrolase-fold protein [Trueperaceae bacterium]|nr:alpha/beta hydrolase-fold protein [Trueperaceae bacterium]